MRPTRMPTSRAVARSCAVARICLPSVVRSNKKNWNAISTAVTPMIRMSCGRMWSGPTEIVSTANRLGITIGWLPQTSCAALRRKIETPIVEMTTGIQPRSRSGWYAIRLNSSPKPAMSTSTSTYTPTTGSCQCTIVPNTAIAGSINVTATYDGSMTNSPCAKFTTPTAL